ncbi:Hypothetical Protein FCC1311_068432 [Hondaea fermentalgiana]|uniref:Uncharacterized protein n=1 Tax=Hondaea fermentalgiana TaxID=2315210 RepID=A0A2R5GPS3_9STRA|nr:Hypothetical Protein FCC1311_068432 [Hondaea fermentalgiana]|eukprot:GBG30623.1 Hypothetical Protein FCC1311_068432 [Hondaea fermentalgiana]
MSEKAHDPFERWLLLRIFSILQFDDFAAGRLGVFNVLSRAGSLQPGRELEERGDNHGAAKGVGVPNLNADESLALGQDGAVERSSVNPLAAHLGENLRDSDSEASDLESQVQTRQGDSLRRWLIVGITTSIMGLIFGFAFAKSRVYEPHVIRAQFLFEKWIMLKMFLAAAGTSAAVFAVAAIVAPAKFEAARLDWDSSRCGRGPRSAALGGMILGSGMAIAGACPGMVLPQVGAGVTNSGFTLLGGIIGAFAYGLLEPLMAPLLRRYSGPSGKFAYVDEYVPLSFSQCSALLALGCGLVVFLLEYLVPWQSELSLPLEDDCSLQTFFKCYAWPPSVGGALIGSLQIPVFAVVGTFLGSSTSYQTTCSSWVLLLSDSISRYFTYAKRFARPTVDTHWQLFYVCMAILGAFLTEYASGLLGKVPGVPIGYGFCGGFLMVWGSRMGAGCTSGHGLSGMAVMMLHSFLAVPFMFGAGIAVAFIARAVDPSFYPGPAIQL